jgi:hypothetical protein
MGAYVNLGLVEDQPPTGAATASFERRPELLADRRRRLRVLRRRPRMRVEDAEDDLPNHVVGQRTEVLIRGFPGDGFSHGSL